MGGVREVGKGVANGQVSEGGGGRWGAVGNVAEEGRECGRE